MKTYIHIIAPLGILISNAYGQGALTPPGAPAPGMKTLGEIHSAIAAVKGEARTPISSAPFTITQPGSYYLTGNLTVSSGTGIAINADNVTLDLNGFNIGSSHPTGNGSGVSIDSGFSNTRIKNGSISGTTTLSGGVFTPGGFNFGIYSAGTTNHNIHISDILISGVSAGGIQLNATTSNIEGCMVNTSGGLGIFARTISGCTATDCKFTAILGTIVANCRGGSIGTSSSDHGISGSTVTDSFGSAVSGNGISCGGTASFSRGSRDGGIAISAGIAIGCTVNGTGTVSSAQKHLGTP